MTLAEWTLQDAAEALQHVDPHPRDTWVRMAMALKAEFGDESFATWDEWSAGASNYREVDARTQWRSVTAGGGIGIGTLIHHAKQGGWQPRREELSEAERQRQSEAQNKRRREREVQVEAEAARERVWHERIAEVSEQVWQDCKAVGRSRYLGQKKIQAHGVGFVRRGMVVAVDEAEETAEIVTGRNAINEFFETNPADRAKLSFRYLKPGTIAVPMRDTEGRLWGLQLIFAGGAKKFLKHGRKRGTFHVIGDPSADQPLAVAEGYATAASIHEATGWPVVVTWDAGNLVTVADALDEAAWPRSCLLLCGDDDHEAVDGHGNPANAGRQYAGRGAARTGGLTAFPRFEMPEGKSDWNDLHVAEGLRAVHEQLEAALLAEGTSPSEEPPPPEPPAEGSAETQGSASLWGDLLVRSGNGALKATLHNVITILEHHAEWSRVYALDAFANEIRKVRPPPYPAREGSLADVDGTEIAAWFGHPDNYGLAVTSGMALESVEAVASRHGYHPVLDYLDALEWDEVPRLDRMLADHFGARFDDYTAAVGANWLKSAVKRVRDPGCKVDFMVILEGEQGRGKSTAVRVLCGPEWFAELIESPQNKDFYQILTGRWLVEIPELQAFNKADRNKIKAAVSAQEDTYRPSYGRYARQFPRQCIFVGTTNDDAYLKDETGARRFLPVRCGHIDIRGLERARDQLWAEAAARLRSGEPWWAFPEAAEAEQDARYDADAWEQPVMQWLDGWCDNDRYPIDWAISRHTPITEVTISEIMSWALKVEMGKQSKPDQMRVGAILRRLNWRRRQRRRYGRQMWLYVRPDADAEAA